MTKPVLVIMAAGMGSRYGGLKQIDPVDKEGNIIIDFSIYDAVKAGFEKVIFIIKKENEEDFRSVIGENLDGNVEVVFAYQDLHNLPEGFEVPEGRVKPWGTAHAVLSAYDYIDGPFAVINADDYYGRDAFVKIFDFLSNNKDDEKYRYCMVGYRLFNTVTDNGHVSRGVCQLDQDGYLVAINEKTHIEKFGDSIKYTEDDGKTWNTLDENTIVSMNMWGFTRSILEEIKDNFTEFLEKGLEENPLKCEYFLPFVVDSLLEEGKATVTVLNSEEKWYGVTYKEDKEDVMQAIQKMKDQAKYPQALWRK